MVAKFHLSLQSAVITLDARQKKLSKHGESDAVIVVRFESLVETLGEDVYNTGSLQKVRKKKEFD